MKFTFLFWNIKSTRQIIVMERKDFLKKGFIAALGLTAIAPLASSCKKEDTGATTGTGLGTGTTGTTSGSCVTSPTETEGPFPTKTPSSLVTNDIRSDRTGVPFTLSITINNKNNNCAALAGAIVDIW